jgi:hypothetical protein
MENREYYYEFFTGAHVPDERLEELKGRGLLIETTTVRPPYATDGVACFTHKTNSWYIRPPANDIQGVVPVQWELNPLAHVTAKDAKNGNWMVVDDVFLDIEQVIEDSNNLEYAVRTWNFYGMTSQSVRCSALNYFVGNLVGMPLGIPKGSLGLGFRCQNASDWNKHQRIHVDGATADWAGIIYMNETEDPRRSGTVLYRHKDYPDRVPSSGWGQDEIKRMFLQGYDEDNFEQIYSCPMVKNRLFLYRGDMFHGVKDWFDGRKVLRMFFHELDVENQDDKVL